MALTKITPEIVAVNAIQGTLIADNAITAVHIATNAVSGTLIADNAVTAVHIAQNVITVTQLADDAVEADKIADGVITTNHLNKAMISSQSEVTAATGDFLLIGDTSDSNNLKKVPVSGVTGLVSAPITALNNATANELVTIGSTTTELDAEATLTFDGTTLVAGNTAAADSVALQLKNTPATAATHKTGLEFYSNEGTANGGTYRAGYIYSEFDGSNYSDARLTFGNGIGSAFGADVMHIKNGKVGIGTTNPGTNHAKANNLVVGSGSAGGMAIYNGTAEGWYAFSRDNANNSDAFDGGISYTNRLMKFHTNAGSSRMAIDASGKVGIGTDSPGDSNDYAETLTLAGSGNVGMTIRSGASSYGSIRWADGTSDPSDSMGIIDYNHSSNSMRVFTNNSQAMHIDTNGNVGIGTSSPDPATGQTQRVLDIRGGSDNNFGGTLRLASLNGSSYSTSMRQVQGALWFERTYSDTFSMIIDSSGKLGIGTSSPAGMLDIPSGSYTATKPAMMLGGDIDTTGAGTRTDNTRKYSSIVGYHYSNEEQPVGIMSYDCQSDSVAVVNIGVPSASYNSPSQISFYTGATSITTSPTERMRILSDGEIVQGSSIADNYAPLVNGITADAIVCNRHSTAGSLGLWRTNTMEWKYYHNGIGYIMEFLSDGDIGGDFQALSDVNLKENISSVTDGMSIIKALRPVKYDWKHANKRNNQHGFIAQEVETALPTAVRGNDYVENPSGNPETEPADNGKTINEAAILAHAVKAIQELEARIAALE